MATDSTELTFVRCPSCRSLVPAISTRCRMCGAGLDASAESNEGADQDKKSGRVRQRTMSQPQSELNAAVGKLRAEEAVADSQTSNPITTPPLAQPIISPKPFTQAAAAPQVISEDEILDGEDDPLSAYIEEVEADEAPPAPVAKPATDRPSAMRPAPIVERSSEPAATERNGNSHEVKSESAARGPSPAAVTSIPAAHIIIPKAVSRPATPAAVEKPKLEAKAESPDQQREPVAAAKTEESAQRVIIESGMRRSGKGSGLSFGKSKEAPMAAETGREEVQEEVVRQSAPPPRQEQKTPERPIVPPPAQRQEQVQAKVERQEKATPAVAPRQKELPAAHAPSAVRKSEAVAGRLFGWIVNYSNPDGEATELREGKFFVTASSLKTTDLIIEDSSISTPHALINVSAEGGLQVQDLMSERGVFIRRRGADSYQREHEPVVVEHGDWVRFGDVEFLVSLIAHVGIK